MYAPGAAQLPDGNEVPGNPFMLLDKRLQLQGAMLFRWRSLLPLVLVPAALLAIGQSHWIEERFGEAVEETWIVFCLAVSFAGVGIRALTIGCVPGNTSGRNTSEQRAASLNTTGAYSMVRNPLYLGNFLMFMGMMLAIQVWWFVAISVLVFALYYERIIMAEEAFLREKFGQDYDAWADRTPAFLPRTGGWVRPELVFSLRTVLRREYNGVCLIAVMFVVIEGVGDVLGDGMSPEAWAREDWYWLVFLGIGLAQFLVLRFIKKRTGLLHVEGR